MKKNILLILSLCLVILSCQKETILLISGSDKEIAVSKEGGFQVFSFETNRRWTAVSSEKWCAIYPAVGNPTTKSITLTIATNDTYSARSCIVTITAGDVSETLIINQAANSGLLVTQDKYDLSNEANIIEVEVQTNVDFDVYISDEWITKVNTRSLPSNKLTFNIAKNKSYGKRDGTITIRQKSGSLTSIIKVFQSQEDAIILSKKTENLTKDSQTLEVELKTNVDFEVIIPQAAKSWVSYIGTRALRNETLLLNIAANEDYEDRTTDIYVKNKSTSLQDTLTINQSGRSGLLVTQDKYDLTNEAASIEVEVKANVDFDVIISDNWITKATTRGLTSTKLSFNIAKNGSYDNRKGSITIKEKNGTLSSTINVYQSQKGAIILSKRNEDLSNDSHALEVHLKTNVNFEVIIPEAAKSWVTYTPTRGLRDETVLLNIAKNDGYTARMTHIYIKDKETSLQDTLTINQSASLGFEVTKDKYNLSNDATSIEVEVKANFEYDIIISDDWITKVATRSLPSNIHQFNIAKNDSYDNRVGTITIKQKNGILKKTIKVYQSQKDAIILSKKTEDLSSDSKTLEVELKTNVDFEVIIPEASKSWVSYTPTRGLRDETVLLNIEKNEGYTARMTHVYIKDKETSLQDTLTINQSASLGFEVIQDKFNLNNDANSIEVEVKANFEYDIIISDDWISKVTTRSLPSNKHQFNIAKNTSYDNREGTITFKQKNGILKKTIKVYQSQKDAIILSKKTEDLSSDSKTLEVELKTNVDFEVIIPEAAQSWVSYTPTRGLRTETLQLNIAKNQDYESRTTEIYVKDKATSLRDTLTINQEANIGFSVSPDKFDLSNDANTIEVDVVANFEFDVIISDDWISKIDTRSIPSSKLSFRIAKNTSYDSRTGSITIKQKNGILTKTITVYQSQKDAIILSKKKEDISSNSQTLEVELKTNVDFEVIIPAAAKNWVSYTPTRGLRTETLQLNIAKNEDYEARTTEIYVKDKATSLRDTLTINQEANLGFSVSPDKFDLSNDANTIEVDVAANFEFDVIISDDWISKIDTRSLPSSKLSFRIAENRSYDSRTGSITIRQKDGQLTKTIIIYQSQEDAIILTNKTENLSFNSQTLEVELNTNVDFEVIIPEASKSWVSFTPTRALRIETLLLSIAENEGDESRSTEIYIKNKATNLHDTLIINQETNQILNRQD